MHVVPSRRHQGFSALGQSLGVFRRLGVRSTMSEALVRLYTVKNSRRTIASKLSLEAAAEVAIDGGGHLIIVDESTGEVAVADADGDFMTIGATERLLTEYEKSASSRPAGKKTEPAPVPPASKPDVSKPTRRWMAAPKRRRNS